MPTCQALEAILKSCDNNSGGIYGIWINQQDEIASITPADPSAGIGWAITAITLQSSPVLFENFYIRRNTSSFTEEAAIDLINGSSFVPSVYQVLALDVNLDGVVSAGDISQIKQRATLSIPEFQQAWN